MMKQNITYTLFLIGQSDISFLNYCTDSDIFFTYILNVTFLFANSWVLDYPASECTTTKYLMTVVSGVVQYFVKQINYVSDVATLCKESLYGGGQQFH